MARNKVAAVVCLVNNHNSMPQLVLDKLILRYNKSTLFTLCKFTRILVGNVTSSSRALAPPSALLSQSPGLEQTVQVWPQRLVTNM